MKKNLFTALLLLIPFIVFSQTTHPIDGAIGIKFGDDGLKVKNIITGNGGKLNLEISNYPSDLKFTNVSLDHFKSEVVGIKFFDEKAYEIGFIFRVDTGVKTIDYYNNIVKSLNNTYGKGQSVRNFKPPYTDGDGNEVTAIKNGYADVQTLWIDNNNNNAIQVKIVPGEFVIILTYQDGKLAEEASTKK